MTHEDNARKTMKLRGFLDQIRMFASLDLGIFIPFPKMLKLPLLR